MVSISDKPLTKFIPLVDSTLPKTGVALDDEEGAGQIKEQLLKDFERIKGLKRASQKTYILDTLHIVQQLIEADGIRKIRWVVILSDMLEDSQEYNFEKKRLTPDIVQDIIDHRKKKKAMPDFHGAKVFVVGAGGANFDIYYGVKEFWLKYFKEANGICILYGRTIPQL